MIGRRAIAGLSLLCALAFGAFAAEGALAQVGTKAVHTTAFTCVKGGGQLNFKDSHCDEKVSSGAGEYGHVSIAKNTTTEIELTNESNWTYRGVLAGVNVEVLCKKAASVKEKSFIHNVLSEEKHAVTGTVQLNLTECEVKKPSKCIVNEPVTLTATFQGVEGLEANEKDEIGIELKGDGAEGSLAELLFENKGAEKCALATGKPFQVQGSMIATGKPSPKEEHSGATWNFETGTVTNTMETLTVGKQPQEFVGTLTVSMAGGGNPIVLAVPGPEPQEGTKAVNTTAVTCVGVKAGAGDFKDAHCDEFVGTEKGDFGHSAIANDTTTEIEVSNETTGGAKEGLKMNNTLAGLNTEIICQKVASVNGKSFIHNVATETSKHTVTGTVQLNLTECEVKNLRNAKLKSRSYSPLLSKVSKVSNPHSKMRWASNL